MTVRLQEKAWPAVLLATLLTGCSDGDFWNPWAGPSAHPSAARAAPAAPAAPADATVHSILLRSFNDPTDHVQQARYFEKTLAEKLGWKGLFVLTQAGHSELYWGQYRSVEEAQTNLKAAKAHRALDGSAPFPQAMVLPLPGPDIGPPEWNLKNCKASYSLLVAVFQDDPQRKYVGRKRFAVDYCKRLRDSGCEGYFYHGPAASHVTIGAFAADSVAVGQDERGQETLTITDPRIKALQQDFPLLAVNGGGVNDIPLDGQGRPLLDAQGQPIRIPGKTYLIRVPRLEGDHAP
jgi:hypothetical protein